MVIQDEPRSTILPFNTGHRATLGPPPETLYEGNYSHSHGRLAVTHGRYSAARRAGDRRRRRTRCKGPEEGETLINKNSIVVILMILILIREDLTHYI